MKTFEFEGKIWKYEGPAAWHFVNLPEQLSKDIKLNFQALSKKWGSIPVKIQTKNLTWESSIFPDTKLGCYLLPIKMAIRKKAKIKEGDRIQIKLQIDLTR